MSALGKRPFCGGSASRHELEDADNLVGKASNRWRIANLIVAIAAMAVVAAWSVIPAWVHYASALSMMLVPLGWHLSRQAHQEFLDERRSFAGLAQARGL